ncbi:MAG: putative zinc- or iron-chelating domain [Acidobacteriota bacterium]|jgi:Fe-S-cluster containining protein|nr:putative zinc- or iron-chelating domain [Acidobacteriota bacterium]
MGSRELPVLNFTSFRKYPSKLDQQEFEDDRQVCHGCVSGVCCSNQDAIYLSSFDIFRLAAYFDMSPARFMLTFTQDQFAGEPEDFRRQRNNDPNDSVVTWLRRRTNHPTSPCIFLKYIREADGTPRRICSVHEARPLTCREFYFDTCKVRGTGELASLLAEGFEKIRDGEITKATVEAQLERIGPYDAASATLSESMEYFFWVEMKCAVNMDQSNVEGSNSYEIAEYQDPIDEKLNRVLSSKYLRFEEWYGAKPRDEQLMPYAGGLGFAGSDEYKRIMAVASTSPSHGLFSLGSYPHRVGARTIMPGAKHSERFQAIPKSEIARVLKNVPPLPLFPQHELPEVRRITLRESYGSILKGFNHLIRFAGDVITIDLSLEYDPPGTLEAELLEMVMGFETSLDPFIAHNPYVKPLKAYLIESTVDRLEDDLKYTLTSEQAFSSLKLLIEVQQGTGALSHEMDGRIAAINRDLNGRLQKKKPALYVRVENPIEARRVAGKSLRAPKAWAAWSKQIRDLRYASHAGFDRIDLDAFYRQSVKTLAAIPFNRSYADQLCEVVNSLAWSMTFNHRIAYEDMSYKDAADTLVRYGLDLFNRIKASGGTDLASQPMRDLLCAVSRGLGLSADENRDYGTLIARLLDSQLPDGSWNTTVLARDAPYDQSEYLRMMFRPTWAAVDALRPLRNDVHGEEIVRANSV